MIIDVFEQIATTNYGKVAIAYEDDAVTYGALLNRINEWALHMSQRFGARDVLGICVRNPIDFVTTYLAAAKSRRKIVLIDLRLSIQEIGVLLHDCGVSYIVTNDADLGLFPAVTTAAEKITVQGRILVAAKVASAFVSGEYHYCEGDFVVHCTSGSTGRPKAIVLSDENMCHRVLNWSKTLELSNVDVILCTLTLTHGHGIDVLMLPGLLTGCLVVAPSLDRLSPRRICSLMIHYNVTIFSSLPYMYELMLQAVSPQQAPFENLRYLISGSAPLAASTAIEFKEKFGKGINQVYGLSEINVICFNKRADHIGYIGELIHGIEAAPIDGPQGDTEFELIVRGKALARGYLNSPDSQTEMFRDGWLLTGDIVREDEKGFRIAGRRSRFINSGGNKINPTEVEEALKTHPLVDDAVVAAKDDPVFTQRVVAFIVAKSPAPTPSELRSYMLKRIAGYKVPEDYIFVEFIPKNSLGKAQIPILMKQFL